MSSRHAALWTVPVLAAGLAMAQEQQQSVPAFISEVRVNNITVDVQVRDDKGVPVTGLKKEDFRILENDQEQVVTNFSVVEGGQIAASVDPELVGQPAPRQIVMFFDLYLMLEADKTRALESLRAFVEEGLAPGVTVAVASFDGTLRVHTEPTARREKVVAALKEVERISATGLQRQSKLATFEARAGARESWSMYEYRRTQNQEYWQELRRMTGRVESAFTATVQRFSGTPGRKVVIMVSPGFPRAENIPIYRDYDFFLDAPPDYRNVGLYGRAAYLASELEYTMYALDPTPSQYTDAESAIDVSRAAPPAATDVADVRFWREADRKDNLTKAARITGGDAIFTRDAGGALADVERLTASFYSLGYQPEHTGDGKEYAIRVSVAGHPEYVLTHRKSYFDRPFEERDAERSRAALLTGENSNPLGIMLVLDKPEGRFKLGAGKMKAYKINAELRIPFAQLTMLPRGDVSWGQVQVVLVGVDAAGNQSELAHQQVPIQLPTEKVGEAREKGYFAYRFTLELEGGTTSVRLAVNDALSHSTSTVLADVKL
jgi:VWFA-related protein